MIRFRVDIYEYVQDRMQTYEIAGYTHNAASSWISFSARLIGASAAARPVRFGIHGGNWCIWIGDPGGVWQYPGVTVRDVQVHYGNVSAALWEAGWSMAFDTSAATNVTATVSQPVAGDTIFGVNALESVGGAIATRANFRTDQGIAAGFVGAGALATQNVAAWGSQIAGRPAAIVDLDSGTHIFADYIRNAGVQLNNRWPAEFGANVTENRISAGFAGAGALATRNNVDWGAHVINRDAWLTDGRIANGLDDAGRNKMGIRGTGGNVGIPEIVGGIAGTNIAINPEFVGGSGIGWGLYDNSGSGKTSISVLADNSAPNASGYMMRVSYNGSGAPNSGPSPGFGGAVQHIQDAVSVLGSGQARPGFYARNTNVYWRIWAKIPAEYTLEPASNAIGDGSEFQWLTSNAGTGAWALYVLRTRIGATGSFSSTGFLHVATGPNVAFTWDIAKFDQIDITSSTRAFLGRGGVSRENGSPVFDADAITSMGVSAGFVGAGPGATAAAADVMNSYVANTLTPIGSYAVVRGNTVSKIGGTHGAFEGGAVGTPVRGGAYVSSSIIGAVEGGSWVTTLALDDDATSFSHGTQLAKIQYNAIAGSGTLSLFVNGGFMGSSSISGVTALSRLRLIYDGTSFKGEVDGISYLSTPAPIGLKLWPKVLDLYLSTNLGGRSPTSDIQYGPWSDSSIGSISLFDRHGGIYYINGGSIHKLPTIAAAWDYSVYTKNSQRGSAYLSGQMVLAGTFIGLTDTITDSNYGSFSYAWHRSENGNWYAFESGSDVYFGTTLNGVIFGPNTVFDVVYDGFNIRYLADGVVMRIVATSAGRLFYGCASAYYNSDQVQISNLAFGPATNLRTYRDDGQTPMPQAEFRTAEGIAAGFLGASAWATYNSRTPTDVSNRLSFLQADGTMRLGSANGVISEGGDYWITNANAVTSLGIAAGFVGAGPGATASATDVLNSYLPFGQNLIPNSDQTQRQNLYLRWNPDGMSLPWGPPQHVANGFVGWSESNYILPGNVKASAVYQSGRVNSPTYGYVDFDINRGDGSRFRTPCVPGERFIASGYFGGHRCDGSLVVCFEDKAGNFLSFTDAPLAVGLDNLQSSLAEMTRVSASAVAPSGAATASIIVKKFNTKPGSPDSYWWCAGIMLERAAANQPGPSPYMPGPPSDTRQLGYTGHLNADVTTQNIAAGFLGAGALATQNVVSWNSQVSGRPEPITNLDSAGFIYADYIRNGGIQLNNRWPAEFGANVTENRIAAGFVGAGALATKNNINLATSDVATIGNIPPTVPDNSFAFTTTTTSVSISWPAITIYRADGSNISVASGSQVVTGLSSGAYYKFYAYIVDSGGGNATVQFVSGGAGATAARPRARASQG